MLESAFSSTRGLASHRMPHQRPHLRLRALMGTAGQALSYQIKILLTQNVFNIQIKLPKRCMLRGAYLSYQQNLYLYLYRVLCPRWAIHARLVQKLLDRCRVRLQRNTGGGRNMPT